MGSHDKELVEVLDFLYRYAITLTKDVAKADDLLQETSLRILTNIDKYEEQGRFGAWAKTVMMRVFINEVNKSSRICNNIVDGYDYYGIDAIHPMVSECDSFLIEQEIHDAINMLPPRYSQMIDMRINGYKYEEIAQKMNISIGCVKSTIFTAKNNLRNIINRN